MQPLLVERDGAIATVIFNRPEQRNALNPDMRSLLRAAMFELEADHSVRCVVIKGAGEHFMGGGDLKAISTVLDQPLAALGGQFLLRLHDLNAIMITMRRMAKPIIASVAGASAGAGVSLALAADIIIADESAFFTLAYCHLGTTPDGGASFQLPRTVGIKKAMEIALLGERFDARTAADIGLVNQLVPTGSLSTATATLAARFASGPSHAYANTKRLLHRSRENAFEAQLQLEAEMFADCATGADFQEGVHAFIAKRPPQFGGD